MSHGHHTCSTEQLPPIRAVRLSKATVKREAWRQNAAPHSAAPQGHVPSRDPEEPMSGEKASASYCTKRNDDS